MLQVNPCSSPETSPRASLDYIPPQCFMQSSNGSSSNPIAAAHDSISVPMASSRSFSPSSQSCGRPNNTKHSTSTGNGSGKREWSQSPHNKPNSTERSNSSGSKGNKSLKIVPTPQNNSKVSIMTTPQNDGLPPATLLALAAGTNTIDSSLMSSPPLQDGDESYKGDSCASFEFIGRQRAQKPQSLIRACSANGKMPPIKSVSKQRSLDKYIVKGANDNVIDLNKINCKRSPSFKESDERETSMDERSLKKDGCSQTDKKDMAAYKLEKQRYNQNPGPFEREIQKLLDEQNLLKNNPPKTELGHQMKDILSLEEMKNVNLVNHLNHVDPIVARYACRSPTVNSNNNSSPLTHHVGLAAIQALARKQQDELNNVMEPTEAAPPPYSFPPAGYEQRESSKESSLKRGRVHTPDSPDDGNKVRKVSSLPRDFPGALPCPVSNVR